MGLPRRRLLFLHPSAELYGADRTLLDLVVGLPKEGYEVLVVLPRRGPLSEELRHRGISVCFRPLGVAAMGSLRLWGLLRLAWDLPRAFFSIRKLARRFQADIVHTNTMVVLGGALGAASSAAKHLWHVHEFPTRPKFLAPLTARLLASLADQVVANSHATAHAFLRHHPSLWRKTTVVHNGIDAKRVQTHLTQRAARQVLDWPQGVPIALVIGRLNTWKGQDLAVQAMQQLADRYPDLRLAIVGGPPPGQEHLETELREQVQASGVAPRVLWQPFDERVDRFYAACDLVLVPSKRPEPFGLVLLEAMAAGKPVLAAGHGGPLEILKPGALGDWFTPGQATDLAEVLSHWLEDPKRWPSAGAAAQAHQRRHFSLRSYQQRMQRLYRLLPMRALGESRASGLKDWPGVIHVVLGKANPDRMNGVNRFVHTLASAQAAQAPTEVWGLTHQPDAPTPVRPYRLRTYPRTRRRSQLAPGLLGRLDLVQGSPSVFHLHGAFLPEMARLGRELRQRGLPYVVTTHGAYDPGAWRRGTWRKALYGLWKERALLRGAQAVHALSQREAEFLQTRFPGLAVVTLPAGQDVAPHANPRPRRTRLQVGSLGRLDAHTKGLDRLLEGFALALANGWQARLLLAGDGPDRERLQAQVDHLHIREHVEWLGEIHGPAKAAFWQEIDLYVQVSRHEGLPGAPLEAAAQGCPLLVSEETNLGPAVRRQGAGWVLDETNRESIAEALTWAALATDEAWAGRVQAARTMVQEEFSWTRILARMQRDLYRQDPDPKPEREAA